MSYFAKITWQKSSDAIFTDRKYSRAHRWSFDGGVELPASSSPHVVPLPYSDENAVDPEEALVAAASSCHMLVFLSIAAAKKFVVLSYEDHAEGIMGKNEQGRESVIKIILSPNIIFGGDKIPTHEQLKKLHHQSHEECYIANSIKAEIETRF